MIVDPQNANNIVGEYTNGTTYSSTDGGHSFNNMSPTCMGQETVNGAGHTRPDCDPAARFVTPIIQDQQNANTWLLGGQFVWVTTAGWNTTCPVDRTKSCSWQHVYDTGAGHAVTALSSANNGQVIYAAWVAGGGNPGPAFASGIATNYGGTWHEVNRAGLPNRYIAGVTVDPSNPAHAFNGYSRRWIPGGGVGHVFETYDGGASWTDISGNLPDAPGDALVLEHGRLGHRYRDVHRPRGAWPGHRVVSPRVRAAQRDGRRCDDRPGRCALRRYARPRRLAHRVVALAEKK